MALHVGKFNLSCKACNDNQKIDRGCFKDSPIPGRWQIGENKFSRCPLSIIEQSSYWFIRAYSFSEKGLLPRSGGWLEQTNKFIEAMGIIAVNIEKE